MIKFLAIPAIVFGFLWLFVGLSMFWSLVLTFMAVFALGMKKKTT